MHLFNPDKMALKAMDSFEGQVILKQPAMGLCKIDKCHENLLMQN